MFNVKKNGLTLFALLSITTVCIADDSLRDPTRPLGHIAASASDGDISLRLQSVLISDTRKIAYINGQAVREQDTIQDSGGIKVRRIETNGVVLQQGAKQWRLDLDNVVIRQ